MHCATSRLTIGLAGLVLLHGSAFATNAAWDCRVGPDGRGWQCFQEGERVQDPVKAGTDTATGVVRPLPPPAMRQPLAIESAAPTLPPKPPTLPAAGASGTTRTALPDAGPAPGTGAAATANAPAAATRPIAEPARPARPAPTQSPVPETPPAPTAPPPAEPATMQAFDDSPMPDLIAPSPAASPPAHPPPPPATATGPAVGADAVPSTPMTGGIDQGIDWDTCKLPPQPGSSPGTRAAADTDTGPVLVSADAAVAELDPQLAVFSGNVELVQGGLQMQADELTLNRASGEVTATGGVVVRHPDVRIAGSAASYQLKSGQAQIEQASYRVPVAHARGDAEHAELLGEGRSRYRNITYTTCRPGDADWLLSAEALELDQAEGLGKARHAKLRFLGVPLLYAPVFTFPIDDRRRSGLLVPSIGQSKNSGFDLSVPYYLNLAENYDLTLVPRLMSKRGLMLGGEFRFLTQSTRGTLAAEFLPNDSEYQDGRQDRGSASLRSRTRFNARTDAALRLNYVSDNDYLSDFGSSLAATSASHLERAGELRYHGDTWDLLGRAQHYQTIDDSILTADRPYSRLPQLLINLEHPQGLAGTTYHLAAEYVNFHRKDSVRGHRVDLFPAVSLPLRRSWGFVEPKVGARYTGYRLTDQAPGLDDSPSRLTGMFSLDSGMYFDRSTDYFGSAATQTLEPRAYYLFVPRGRQHDQPIFDTGLLDFNFDNLFRENRFNGADRFGDANQLTLALTSRMLSDQSGGELLRASIGQITYFADREVTLPGESFADDSTSAVVAELAAQLGGGWHARAGLQWDPHGGGSGSVDQALAQVSYRDNQRRLFNAAYRLRDGVTEQTDLAAFWPINEQWSLVGRHNHSLQDDRLLEALAGIEYGRCCWRLRALVRKYADGTGDAHNLAFLIQLELNGLGRLGDDIDQTLERGIYGYRTDR